MLDIELNKPIYVEVSSNARYACVAVWLFTEGLFDEPGATKRGENIPKLGSTDIVAFNTRFVDSCPDVFHAVE
jgi:hypothetical protein